MNMPARHAIRMKALSHLIHSKGNAMDTLDKNTAETLNTVQIVLRHLMKAIALSGDVDLERLAKHLESAADATGGDLVAQNMLLDLCAGALRLLHEHKQGG